MKKLSTLLLIAASLTVHAQVKSWEGIHATPIATAQKNFVTPPVEFASHVIWGWEGAMDLKTMRNDLDTMYSRGFRSVIFEAGYGLPYQYLSDEWFKAIATAVKEAKKRGMKVWIIDEGKYPSGFAGGKFTRERPDLRMQALVVCDTIRVQAGQVLTNYPVDEHVLSAIAVTEAGLPNRTIEVTNHQLNFNAGIHNWQILLVRADFRTAVTRAVNNPIRGAKDASNSICDYLNPVAVRQFIDWTHEQYKKYLGKELGTTVLGFRGDEPDYAHTPWTPAMVETFTRVKGYNPTPYLASLFAPVRTEQERRFRADYWDVWSTLFADNFFKQQADWCEANGVAHITHLNNEHNMPVCVRAEGDFFRTLSKVQIPGVDAIWNQIWPETVNDFPKLASSVAHVYGRPRSFSESFAAYNIPPTIPQAKYAVDYQMVRGINFFEFMFWASQSNGKGWMSGAGMDVLNAYTNRVTYLLAQGTPGARVAMYYPTANMWLGNNEVAEHINTLTQELLKHQYDFDYVNDDAFTEALSVESGYLKNRSGQKYSTLIIPSADAITVQAWEKIQAFVRGGGKLLFWGKKPEMLVDRNFMNPQPFPADYLEGITEPSPRWTAAVQATMPAPEMRIQLPPQPKRRTSTPEPQPAVPTDFIRYTHRILPDADVYFLFNEGESGCTFTAEFDHVGEVQAWDGNTGAVTSLPCRIVAGKTVVELDMPAWDSRVIIIRKSDKQYDITAYGAVGDGVTINTAAIQRAIDTASAQGGGCVVVPEGTFLSDALFFPAGVDLQVKKNAVLRATVAPDAFPVISTRFEGIERDWRCAFLNFNRSQGVKVYGEGTIDGQGVQWKAVPFGNGGRPRLLCFTECNGGSLSGLHLRDQASWCVHVLYTNGFSMNNLDIRSEHTIPSSDGIDVDSSTDISIRRVYIDVNDDCISIKSGKDADGRRVARPSERILIEDCHFAYGHGGVALGSEISGDIRNVMVRNCRMDGDNWGPIRFKSQPGRGGVVENITFQDITLNNTRSMLDINMEWRMIGNLSPAADVLTRLKNIRIINVKGEVQNVGTMHGYGDAPFGADVFSFENCEITARQALSKKNADAVSLNGLTVHLK